MSVDLLDMITKNNAESNETPRDLESKVAKYTVESVMAEMDSLAKNRLDNDSKPPQVGSTYSVQSLNISAQDKMIIDNAVNQYIQDVNLILSKVMSNSSTKSESSPTIMKSSEVSTKNETSLTIPQSTLNEIEKVKMATIEKVKALFTDSHTDWSIYLESKMNETPSEVSSYLSTLTPPIEVTKNTNSYLESVLSVKDEAISFTGSLKNYANTFDVTKTDVFNLMGEKVVDDVAKGVNKNTGEVADWVGTIANSFKSNLNERIDNLSNIANSYSLSDIGGDKNPLKSYDVTRDKLGLGNYMSAVTSAWYIDINPHNNNGSGPPSLKAHFFSDTGNFYLPIISFQLSGESINSTSLPIFGGINISVPSSYARPTSCSIIMPSVYSTSINIGKDIGNDLLSTVNIVSGTGLSEQKYNQSGPCLLAWKRDYIEYVTCNDKSGKKSNNQVRNYQKCAYEITLIRKRFKGDTSKRNIESFKYLAVPVNINIQMSGESDTSTQSFDSVDFQIVGDNYS